MLDLKLTLTRSSCKRYFVAVCFLIDVGSEAYFDKVFMRRLGAKIVVVVVEHGCLGYCLGQC